jgi:Protein of unknown function (DUF3102)
VTSNTEGAASAAPFLSALAEGIREDLAAIEGDNRSALAHAIAAGEKLNVAKAQLEHGEWLPWLHENFALSRKTAAEYMRLAIPANVTHALHFNSIREALAALPKGQTYNRTVGGSLRLWTDPEVMSWVAARRAERWDSKRIVAASKAKTDGWPSDKSLSNGSCTTVFAVLDAVAGQPVAPTKKKGPTVGGKRRRKVWEDIRKDGATELREMQVKIAEAVMALEHYVLPEDIGLSEEEQDDITDLFNDLTTLLQWTERAMIATTANMDDLSKRRTIRKLQDLAQDPGASAGERQNALRGIEKLQASQRAKRLGARSGAHG